MATLLTLANETLLQVIAEIPPDDILAFSTSCKTTSLLSTSAITEHRRLTITYRSVSFGDPCRNNKGQPCPEGPHPLLLLQDIIENPRVCYYPTTLSVGRFFLCVGRQRHVERVLQEYEKEIRSLIRNCGYIRAKEREDWLESIKRNDLRPMYTLLLTMLPNVKNYRTMRDPFSSSSPSDTQVCNRVLPRIANSYKSTKVVKGRPLTKLSRIEILPSHTRHPPRALISILPFMALPSLQSMSGENVVGGLDRQNHVGEWWNPSSRTSNVTEIELRNSDIEDATFFYVLPHARKLKRFTMLLAADTHFPRTVVNTLADYCIGSLEYLHLTSEWLETQTCYYDLDMLEFNIGLFEKLEYLRVDYTIFYDYSKKGREKCTETNDCECQPSLRLVDVLPPSIKTVILEGEIPDQRVGRLLTGMTTLKRKNIPKLEVIYIDSPLVESKDLCQRLEKVGVRLCTFGTDGVEKEEKMWRCRNQTW